VADLERRTAYLNNKRYTSLKFRAPGTDLNVGLADGHIWLGGAITSRNNITFVPNLPTEEVFTMPHKHRIDGVVQSTKPLSYGGSLIEDFSLRFADGRVVNAEANVGQRALDTLLDTDEGSRSLGEVALVPHSSPISQSNVLFLNTLFDENASCHVALGQAYRMTVQDGVGMDEADYDQVGGNVSLSHSDFMIGSAATDIDGIREDGSSEAVMRQGEWAFSV
jgi:aminopeptidase